MYSCKTSRSEKSIFQKKQKMQDNNAPELQFNFARIFFFFYTNYPRKLLLSTVIEFNQNSSSDKNWIVEKPCISPCYNISLSYQKEIVIQGLTTRGPAGCMVFSSFDVNFRVHVGTTTKQNKWKKKEIWIERETQQLHAQNVFQ